MTPPSTHASPRPRVFSSPDDRSRLLQWVVVFVIALVVRGSFGFVRLARADDPSVLEFPDEEQFWLMAGSLSAGEGLRDELDFRATRMPLYPAALSLLAGFEHGIPLAKVIQWFLGAFLAVGVAGMAADLFDRRVGWAAGLIVALDPFLVFFTSLLLTETLFCTFTVLLWWGVVPMLQERPVSFSIGRCTWIGALASLCVYTRESSLGMVAVLLLFVLYCRRFERRALWGIGLTSLLVGGSLVPWALRNQRVTGHWCWLTHRAGISLYDGVGPQADGSSRLGGIKQRPEVQGKSEAAWDQYFLDESVKAVRSDPGRVLRLAGIKLLRMWNPMPNAETYQSPMYRVLAVAWTVPTFLLAIAGMVLLIRTWGAAGWRSVFFLLIPAGYLSVVHSVFVGSVRYRLPAIPMIEMVAAFAICTLLGRISQMGGVQRSRQTK